LATASSHRRLTARRDGRCCRGGKGEGLDRGPVVGFAQAGGEEPMTGTTRSSEGLDVRRRKLLFRSWHRGMREMDLIMGRFADAAVAQLTQEELTEFEQLMEVPDRELLAWITGEAAVPADHDTTLFRRLRDFNHRRERTR
jgi:antitoxin CptB